MPVIVSLPQLQSDGIAVKRSLNSGRQTMAAGQSLP